MSLQEDLNKLKSQVVDVLLHIQNGDEYPDEIGSWDMDLIAIDHDMIVLEYGIQKGYTTFNEAYEALMQEKDNGLHTGSITYSTEKI